MIKKSNQLVNARFDFSVHEIRLFTLMISQIGKEDEDFKVYKIPINEFVKIFNIRNKNIYKELEQTTDSLIKKIIKIPIEEWGQQKLFKTSLVNSFKYNIDGSGVIEATFHPDLKPYLLQLKNRFLMYDMKHVLNISSSNSIRMYELLKAFEGIGKRTFEVEELKEILGIAEKYNNRYFNFKKRIILQAQKDLTKHTDIGFTFKESKKPGTKKVHKITFYISPNQRGWQPLNKPQQPLLLAENSDHISRLSLLKSYKFSQEVIETQIAEKYDTAFIEQTLKYCKKYFKHNKVTNKEGFLLKALEKWFFDDKIQADEKKQKQKIQHSASHKDKKQEEQKKEEERKQHFQHALASFSDQELEDLKQEFLNQVVSNKFFKIAYDAKGFEHKLIQGQREIFLVKKHSKE